MEPTAHLLREIVLVAGDGAEFYEHAQKEIRYPDLAAVFARMALAKRELIASLAAPLRASGEQLPHGGTVLGALRRAYADVHASLSSDDVEVYVAQLEDTEDRLLDHVREAIRKSGEPEIRSQLEAHLPKVRACHDEMRRLSQQLAAAA